MKKLWKMMSDKDIANVILYTSSTCPMCKALKAKLLDKQVPFEEKSIDDDNIMIELYMAGRCTVPVLIINSVVIDDIDRWLQQWDK